MRTAALIAVAAILALSLGGLVFDHDKVCCGKAASVDAGPCSGLCAPVAQTSTATLVVLLFGWSFLIPIRHSLPLMAHPIEKPPA